MIERVIMVDGDSIQLVSKQDAIKITRRQVSEMIQQLTEELIATQPMYRSLPDGLTFPMKYEPKS